MQQQVESEKKKEVQLNKQLALLTEQIALQRSITFEKLREIKIAEQAEGRQKDIKNAEILPGGGVGVRYMMIPKERINIGIDVAAGKGDWGLYFRIGESFGR